MRSRLSVAGWDWVKLREFGQVYRWTGSSGLAGPPAGDSLGGLQPGQPLRDGSALRESSGRRAFRAAAQKFAGCVRVNFECARVPFLFPATRECPLRLGPASSGTHRTVLRGRKSRGKLIVDSPRVASGRRGGRVLRKVGRDEGDPGFLRTR